jgi:tRNA wybutosine-synthesizing protein 3
MKLDKSPQGFYDEDIIPLLNLINKKYHTTSSCSGRITLMKRIKKGQAEWIYKAHSSASSNKIYDLIQKHKQLRFLYEPLIIHIQCKDEKEAENLLKLIQSNGFKKSCLISFKNYTLEVNDTGKMETLVIKDLPKKYIQTLTKEANKRLKHTKENIKKLELLFA